MKNFVCWHQDDVQSIMNTDADYTPDYIFAAVHNPVSIKKKFNNSNNSIHYSQEELLKDFTNNANTHLVVPILGESGSGKSHLVHWLKTHIPTIKSKQEVLLIPKAGTNLKNILSLILKDREGPRFDEYRKRLMQSTQQIDAVVGRSLLLDKLAQQITFLPNSFFEEKLGNNVDNELLHLVKNSLPDLLYDPHFRNQYWLKEGGVIARLYNLALGTINNRERLEDRRQFSQSDLPIDMFDYTAAGEAARNFVSILVGITEAQVVCIHVLNASLDEAIRELLIGGEDLTELMKDVRRQLYDEGITLILLIEDFAKMQGIDGAILEAIIQQSTPENRLCPIRTALACTDGYYGNIPDTFKTRVNFTIWVEYNKEEINYNSFAALYLNAVRIGVQKLEEEFSGFKDVRNIEEWKVSNACLNCEFQTTCHAAFGTYNGIGLYPFNEVASRNLYERLNSTSFTPREFINRVVKEVSYYFAPDIEYGNFPSHKLMDYFGGRVLNLRSNELQVIESEVGRKKAEQVVPLIEFWADDSREVNDGIYEAFDLPKVKIGAKVQSNKVVSDVKLKPQELSPPTQLVTNDHPIEFDQLEEWRNGHQINQHTQREVRKKLFEAISNFINWDDLGLIRSEFFGPGPNNYFKEEKIFFSTRDESRSLPSKVRLLLPLSEDERISTTIALQGLVLYYHNDESWDFDTDKSYFLAFSKHIKQWSEQIIEQITSYSEEDKSWNPLMGIVQWMYLGARLSGNLKPEETSLVDIWERLNEPWSFNNIEYRSPALKKIIERLERNKDKVFDQLYVHALCPKGQVKGLKYFDLSKVIPVVRKVHREGKPFYVTPRGIVKRYDFLEVLDQAFQADFRNALDNEIANYKACLSLVVDALGDPENLNEAFTQLRKLFEDIEVYGQGHLVSSSSINEINMFLSQKPYKLGDAIRNSNKVTNLANDIDGNFPEIVSRIGRSDFLKTMNEVKDAVGEISIALNKVQQSLQKVIESKKSANEGNVETSKKEIESALSSLVDLGGMLESFNEN